MELLPAGTSFWFLLAVYASGFWISFSLGEKVAKITAIVLWAIFLITLATTLLHLA